MELEANGMGEKEGGSGDREGTKDGLRWVVFWFLVGDKDTCSGLVGVV